MSSGPSWRRYAPDPIQTDISVSVGNRLVRNRDNRRFGWLGYAARPMKLNHPLNKAVHMEILRTVLPDRYSPLQANGNGIQSIYLTELSWDFAEVLSGLIGQEARSLITATEAGLGAQAQIPLPMRRPRRGCNGLQDRCTRLLA